METKQARTTNDKDGGDSDTMNKRHCFLDCESRHIAIKDALFGPSPNLSLVCVFVLEHMVVYIVEGFYWCMGPACLH